MADCSGGPSYYEMVREDPCRCTHGYMVHREGMCAWCSCGEYVPRDKGDYGVRSSDYSSGSDDLAVSDQRVTNPPHYTWLKDRCGVEVWDITQHMNFNTGNVLKYVLRHEHKGGVEDLQKARQYLDKEIERLS